MLLTVLAGALGVYAYKHWKTGPQEPISGRPWVIDGDTVSIAKLHIRLEGIDAPETEQTCTDAGGKAWPCGRIAARELRKHISAQDLTCKPRVLDKFGRVLAVCFLADGTDLNAWMVRQGWALAFGFDKIYEAEENEAKAARRGVWTGTFMPPWEWRRDKPS